MDFPGEDEVRDAADDQQPANEDGDAHAADERDEDGKEAGQDEQDAEEDGPSNGLVGD